MVKDLGRWDINSRLKEGRKETVKEKGYRSKIDLVSEEGQQGEEEGGR